VGDRQIGDVRMGRKSGSGDIVSELCYANFDNWLMALIGHDISTGWPTAFTQISASTISFAADTGSDGGTIADSGLGLGSISVGDYITVKPDMMRWAAEYKQKYWVTRDDGTYKCFVTRKP
jgi:hypothetical protein